MYPSTIAVLLALSSAWASPVVHYDAAQQTDSGFVCHNLTIPVPITQTSSKNYTIDNYDVEFFYEIQAFKTFQSGTYNVSAVYCAPPNNSSGKVKDTIQFLNHGATFKKEMWDFPYQPERYSWVRRMHSEGYATFAWDQIGSGQSDHPDGLFVVQTEAIIEAAQYLINLIKTGQIGGIAYQKVAYIGFSIGSVAGVSLSAQYPHAADAMILHGFSWDVTNLYPGYLAGLQAPVNTLERPEWKQYSSYYQSQSTPASRQAVVFFGDYDPAIVPVDFELRDMDALGLALSFGYHLVSAPQYTGPVFIGDGNQDSSFCDQECGSRPYEVYDRYPLASDYDVKVYNNTGHGIHMHYSGAQLMTDTLAFLARNGM